MINVNTGEFKLDGSELIIHPELSLSDFKGGDIPIREIRPDETTGYTTCFFSGVLDGLKADFVIKFRYEHLCYLTFEDNSAVPLYAQYSRELNEAMRKGGGAEIPVMQRWGKVLYDANEARKQKHDSWLARIIGSPPPYYYEWGSIGSGFDHHSACPLIGTVFKYQILEREPEVTDLKAYFEARHKESLRMEEEIKALRAKPQKSVWWNPFQWWTRS